MKFRGFRENFCMILLEVAALFQATTIKIMSNFYVFFGLFSLIWFPYTCKHIFLMGMEQHEKIYKKISIMIIM